MPSAVTTRVHKWEITHPQGFTKLTEITYLYKREDGNFQLYIYPERVSLTFEGRNKVQATVIIAGTDGSGFDKRNLPKGVEVSSIEPGKKMILGIGDVSVTVKLNR